MKKRTISVYWAGCYAVVALLFGRWCMPEKVVTKYETKWNVPVDEMMHEPAKPIYQNSNPLIRKLERSKFNVTISYNINWTPHWTVKTSIPAEEENEEDRELTTTGGMYFQDALRNAIEETNDTIDNLRKSKIK